MEETKTIVTREEIDDARAMMAAGTFATRPFMDRSRFLLTYGYLTTDVYHGNDTHSDLRYQMHNYILGLSQTWSK